MENELVTVEWSLCNHYGSSVEFDLNELVDIYNKYGELGVLDTISDSVLDAFDETVSPEYTTGDVMDKVMQTVAERSPQ